MQTSEAPDFWGLPNNMTCPFPLKCGKKAKLSEVTLLPEHPSSYRLFMRKCNKEMVPI